MDTTQDERSATTTQKNCSTHAHWGLLTLGGGIVESTTDTWSAGAIVLTTAGSLLAVLSASVLPWANNKNDES